MNQKLALIYSLMFISLVMLTVYLSAFHSSLYFYKPGEATTVNIIYEYLLVESKALLPNFNFIDIHERRHLLDVKRLLIDIKWLSIFAFIGVIGLLIFIKFASKKKLSELFYLAGKYGLFLNIIVAFTALLLFKPTFLYMHELFFNQGTWIFPKDSLLVALFPISFFKNFAYIVIGSSTLIFFLMWLLSSKKIVRVKAEAVS